MCQAPFGDQLGSKWKVSCAFVKFTFSWCAVGEEEEEAQGQQQTDDKDCSQLNYKACQIATNTSGGTAGDCKGQPGVAFEQVWSRDLGKGPKTRGACGGGHPGRVHIS